MTRRVLSLTVVGCLAWAAAAFAQPPAPSRVEGPVKVAGRYDPAAEITIKGTVIAVISTRSAGDVVGVHMEVTTDRGMVKVHLGPALFIGENNFWFLCEDQVAITGAMVSHGGSTALWGRTITKGGKTLALRSDRGEPLWKVEGQLDPDGCGIAHPPVR